MSTNYYWIYEEPEVPNIRLPTGEYIVPNALTVDHHAAHIGKRYGTEKGCKFIWAIDPAEVGYHLDRQGHKWEDHDRIVIRDEYGRTFSWKDFSVVLYDCIVWELHAIGERFC